ncbi:hypothetical protein GCM10009533_11990 [Saccharopolyspora spinosporotrichia]|uniref:Uncharacterized protein n=1 Tax=Saccharopolyspora erythraea TaxID=1836 RepID=A0ABN1C9P2_SACER
MHAALAQSRIAGVRKDLVDAAARHHVAAQEEGDLAHAVHPPRPGSRPRHDRRGSIIVRGPDPRTAVRRRARDHSVPVLR